MLQNHYIGITGFMSRSELTAVLDALPDNFGMIDGEQIRRLMVGMLVSGKTIQGIPNKWPNRYPAPEALSSIFVRDPRVLNLVHYNTKAETPGIIIDELSRIKDACGKYFQGFQLNMVWPKASLIHDWLFNHSSHSNAVIVLQCGSRAMANLKHSPEELAEKLKEYEGVIDYVLLDPSGGIGIPFDAAFALRCLEAIDQANITGINIGVAGGLSPETIPDLLPPILQQFPTVSIDAEGRLRTAEDHLNVEVASEYIRVAENLFRQYQPEKTT